MELRRLTIEDLAEATGLLQLTFDNCVLPQEASRRTRTRMNAGDAVDPGLVEDMAAMFRAYTSAEALAWRMAKGELFLWGLWDKVFRRQSIYEFDEKKSSMVRTLVGVGAMTPAGQVTLLYVHPLYQRRGYGKLLLEEMQRYAGTELSLPKVWCNAAPVWTGGYFQRRGFAPIRSGQPVDAGFVSLCAPSFYQKNYQVRKLPGWIGGLFLGGSVFLAFLAGVLYLVLAMF